MLICVKSNDRKMDGLNWRHTLVSWVRNYNEIYMGSGVFINCIICTQINQINFIESPIEDIAHFDVNEFFAKFKEKMQGKVEIKEDLLEFIKRKNFLPVLHVSIFNVLPSLVDYYPDFEPQLDETSQIIVHDFMFIYSIFLHFSCVMFPEPFFHSKCISLKPKCQSSIKTFLEIVAKSEKFDRNSLRMAIRDSTPENPRLSFLYLKFNSPQRTAKNFKNSPPTPTSQLLDEKGREVKLLKAQLDSEKYERGFLEVQVKQYEERLTKLGECSLMFLANFIFKRKYPLL